MKAIVKTREGKGFLELQDVKRPKPERNEVIIKIKAAGICGTDMHIRDGSFYSIPPVIIGHEFSGEIVELGPDVSGYSVGDRVVAEPHRGGCGQCEFCRTGAVEMCRQKRALGYKEDGVFTSYTNLPATSLHRIPDSVTFEEAALTEPLAVAVKAVFERSGLEAEDFVVVLGCGPIGMLAAAAAKADGARAVMITGTNQDEGLRLPAARKLGIDYVANVQKDDVNKMIMDLTGGKGADVVIEASGAEPAIKQAMEVVKINGRVCSIGITGRETIAMPYDRALLKSVTLSWSMSTNWLSWERALSMLGNGKVDVKNLVTHTFQLEEYEKAFELLEDLKAIKIILYPNEK
ncbi:MAG: alcohol dehydrogenase catalytic domain-containing protein [Spirochaetota bacterium]|nr:alcohol dehydrogenase catalytic domain-containing protein [Spirochaetota bacterium]